MLPGSSGLTLMPVKMAGREMMTIEPSIADISTPRVVFDRATHL